jgi:hypothetical protein
MSVVFLLFSMASVRFNTTVYARWRLDTAGESGSSRAPPGCAIQRGAAV